MPATESNKARIAKRVIEVLEFFDEEHPQATVMDIVRRFDRPQSSTSELLSNLVGLGLLYKDRQTRSYSLTPRAAMLGGSVQPRLVREGRLVGIIDRLSAQTGLGVGVFSMVGLKVQVCTWRNGNRKLRTSSAGGLYGGQQEHLSDSAVGWLLLSTVRQPNRDGMIRRLNAEATPDRRFAFPDMSARVQQCRDDGQAIGIAGFGSIADVTAILLPGLPENQPLAVGLLYEPSERIDHATLLRSLRDAVARSVGEEEPATSSGVQSLFHAA